MMANMTSNAAPNVMTFSNKMTVLRGIASVAFVPIVLVDDQLYRVFALLIFTVAAFTDYYDGKLARLRKEKTIFGVIADPIADKFLTAVGFVAVSWLQPDIVPWWMTFVIIIREIVVTILRFQALAVGRVLAADRWGKWKTGLQMTVIPYGLVFASLFSGDVGRGWELIVRATVFGQGIYVLGYALAFVTTLLTIWSGLNFLITSYGRPTPPASTNNAS